MAKQLFVLVLFGVLCLSPEASKIVKKHEETTKEDVADTRSKVDGLPVLPNPGNPISFEELRTSGKIFKQPSGGATPEALQKIRELANMQRQQPQTTQGGSNSRDSTKGGSFPFTLYDIAASNKFDFGKFHRKPQRTSTGGSRPHGGGTSGGTPTHGGSSGSGSHVGYGPALTTTDYKHIWIQMLQEIYKIMNDKHILHDSSFGKKVLDHLFYLLQDLKILNSHQPGRQECPDIYYQSGDLCLSVDVLDTFLDFYEARLYCQTVKGSDLVMFRDANEFRSIIEFIQKIDPKNQHSYWLGMSDVETEGQFLFLDSRHVHPLSPFWGVRPIEQEIGVTAVASGLKRDPTTGITNEIAPFNIGDYAILNKDDFYRIWDADSDFAEEKKTLPLCQYIPERDQQNFQYGEGVFEDWQEYNELAGWHQDDRYEKQPPHSHYGYGPLGYGWQGFLDGYHTPWRRSSRKEDESA